MALGERIKACRQGAGMSQEKVAELVGVSRQAVTKWEGNQSAPNTENLFRLAEIFGTTVDMLLMSDEGIKQSMAEQMYSLYKAEEEKKGILKKQRFKKNILNALFIAFGYIIIYLLGRIIWCNMSQSSLTGWLFTVRPSGKHSYLYGWLLNSSLFWYVLILSVIPALFGKYKFSCTTFVGFLIGFIAGMIFGSYPEGTAIGHNHYGWAIWGASYLISIVTGVLVEIKPINYRIFLHLEKRKEKQNGTDKTNWKRIKIQRKNP